MRRFAFKVQQFTGPMMAKSLEDTAFYRYHRLLALNEVGGDPAMPMRLSVAQLPRPHAGAQRERLPHGLTATATHDTKRGEDARARLLALSELADEWDQAVERMAGNECAVRCRSPSGREPRPRRTNTCSIRRCSAPGRSAASTKTFVERMQAYAHQGGARGQGADELARTQRSSTKQASTISCARILDRAQSADFIDSFDAFARRAALIGALNSLAQVTLKATMPGVPDFYQGTEFWDLSLVDPDNRRPVDFAARVDALGSLSEPWIGTRLRKTGRTAGSSSR